MSVSQSARADSSNDPAPEGKMIGEEGGKGEGLSISLLSLCVYAA